MSRAAAIGNPIIVPSIISEMPDASASSPRSSERDRKLAEMLVRLNALQTQIKTLEDNLKKANEENKAVHAKVQKLEKVNRALRRKAEYANRRFCFCCRPGYC